ncbi:hypothetical protein B0H21DRAFT_710688 [Amylocystis lapponica]|nr:hypothetical protein B0H21DRAFT_710688 [Amylocystis lapponica]
MSVGASSAITEEGLNLFAVVQLPKICDLVDTPLGGTHGVRWGRMWTKGWHKGRGKWVYSLMGAGVRQEAESVGCRVISGPRCRLRSMSIGSPRAGSPVASGRDNPRASGTRHGRKHGRAWAQIQFELWLEGRFGHRSSTGGWCWNYSLRGGKVKVGEVGEPEELRHAVTYGWGWRVRIPALCHSIVSYLSLAHSLQFCSRAESSLVHALQAGKPFEATSSPTGQPISREASRAWTTLPRHLVQIHPMSDEPVKLLDGAVDVRLAQRPPRAGEVLKATDCRVVAELSSTDGIWISSPNVNWLPDPPVHSKTEPLGYYADGMMGPFELYKWPQHYDQLEPHGLAAPTNTQAMSAVTGTDGPRDDDGALPAFADPEAPWMDFKMADFDVKLELPRERVGMLRSSVVKRLEAAAQDTVRFAEPIWKEKYGSRPTDTAPQAQERAGRRRFILERLSSMCRAVSKLDEVPMPSLDVKMWFREAQRVMLEARAWVVYESVIVPRLRNPEGRATRALPLRGIITSRLIIVEDLYRIGVPVCMTTATVVYRICSITPVSKLLSNEKQSTDGRREMAMPAWGHTTIVRPLGESLAYQMRRYSLSGAPVLARLLPVWDDPPTPADGGSQAGSARGTVSSAMTESAPPPAPTPRRAAHASRGKARPQGSAKGTPATQSVPKVPDWVQQPCQGWERALKLVQDLPSSQQHHSGKVFVYALPPPNAFYTENAASRAHLIHNWTHIRQWCIAQALNPPQNARVLMTANQWHLALEGAYYGVPAALLTVPPQSLPADIARLPDPPVSAKRVRVEDQTVSVRTAKRISSRVDIAVRMGVHGNFPPFDADTQVGYFGKILVDKDAASEDRDLWSEVMIRSIWSEVQAVQPSLGHEIERDQLSQIEWYNRQPAFEQWSSVMNSWPIEGPPPPISLDRTSEKHFEKFEVQVITYYCRAFHRTFARLPTVPMRAPWSILRHRHGNLEGANERRQLRLRQRLPSGNTSTLRTSCIA